ncbi:MAG: hypothetical protein KC503_34905 [Myxococcales bacterium]|nr:hypothetical protein [Myxococcales bacterium]
MAVLAASVVAASLVVALAACRRPPVAPLPIPQQRDWYFIRGGYRISTVKQTSSSYTTGDVRVTATVTTRAEGLIGGIERPRREGLAPAKQPGERALRERDPSLANKPFRPLSQQPELP